MDEQTRVDKERKLLDDADELLDQLPQTLVLRDYAPRPPSNFWKNEVPTREVLEALLRERFHTEMEYKDYARRDEWAGDPDKMRLLDYVYEKG